MKGDVLWAPVAHTLGGHRNDGMSLAHSSELDECFIRRVVLRIKPGIPCSAPAKHTALLAVRTQMPCVVSYPSLDSKAAHIQEKQRNEAAQE